MLVSSNRAYERQGKHCAIFPSFLYHKCYKIRVETSFNITYLLDFIITEENVYKEKKLPEIALMLS